MMLFAGAPRRPCLGLATPTRPTPAEREKLVVRRSSHSPDPCRQKREDRGLLELACAGPRRPCLWWVAVGLSRHPKATETGTLFDHRLSALERGYG
jgi:hypothetical protein